MTESISIEDVIGWIEYHLGEVEERTHKEISSIQTDAADRGMLKSSVAANLVIACGQRQMKEAATRAVGEFQRVSALAGIPAEELLSTLDACVRASADRIEIAVTKSAKGSVGNIGPYQANIDKIKKEAEFALRHARTGFLQPPEPPVPPTMGNKINIETMTGGAIQQGTTASTQNVEIRIDTAAAKAALSMIEQAISSASLGVVTLSSLSAEVDTIKAQLTKPEPSQSILREAWISLRRVVEETAAGVAASQIPAAVVQLGRALGLA